jgi:cholesterol transport system auxiliary component
MLAPLIVATLQAVPALGLVVLAPSAAVGDLLLDTEIVRLQQDFDSLPSRVHLVLRATLIDAATQRVVATREFDQSVAAASEDPYGGVVAANRAVQDVLEDLAGFCNETAAVWRRTRTDVPQDPAVKPARP